MKTKIRNLLLFHLVPALRAIVPLGERPSSPFPREAKPWNKWRDRSGRSRALATFGGLLPKPQEEMTMRNHKSLKSLLRKMYGGDHFAPCSGFPWRQGGRWRSLGNRLLLVSAIIAMITGMLPTSYATADSLDRTINLVLDEGFEHVSQANPLWGGFTIGPNEVRMSQCGSFLAVLSAVANYLLDGLGGIPWYSVNDLPLDFNPLYLDAYFSVGAGGFMHHNWGYKNTGDCSVQPSQYAPLGMAQSGLSGLPFGIRLKKHDGFDKDLVDGSLLLKRPIIVLTLNEAINALHAQLIVGWDNDVKKYLILDPLWSHTTVIGPDIPPLVLPRFPPNYSEWERSVSTTINPWAVPLSQVPSTLIFGDDPSPIEIQMINPEGQKTGFDPATQRMFEQVPSANYWRIGAWADPLGQVPPGDLAKYISVSNPVEGTYRFQVIGTGDGPFTVSASVVAGVEETVLQTVSDTITTNEVRKFEFHYSTTPPSTVSEVTNFTPEVKIGDDVKGRTDTPIELDGRRSFDADGSIVSFEWDFGDGTSSTGEQVSHIYTTPGVYTVQLTVTDDGGATATATLQADIILSQQRPVAHASGPYFGFAASTSFLGHFDFDARKSSDPNGDPLTFKWDFGDGSPMVEGTFPVTRHSYTTPGKYTVTLIVNDGIDDSEPVTTTAEVMPPPESSQLNVSALPSCGAAGTPINFQLDGLILMEYGHGIASAAWDFGAEGPLPPIPSRITLGIPGTPDGQVRLRVWGPNDTFDEFIPWTAAFTGPAVFSLRMSWIFPASSETGEYVLELGEENTTTFQVPCPEPDNHPPLAHAGGPTYVGNAGVPITFDGSRSSDPDGDPLTYIWYFGDGNTGTGVNPQHTYAEVGEYFVTLVVNDGQEDSYTSIGTHSFAEAVVEAGGNQPVVCSTAEPSMDMLWPPNHKLVPIHIVGVTDPDDDPVTFTITGVTQDEPVNGLGDGNTAPDATGVGTDTVKVRAERSGRGDGRVYHLDFTADDGNGGVCTSTVSVCVPHDQGEGNACIDQGRLFDSTGN